MTDNKETETWLTIKDVSRILNIHKNTVRRWSDRGIMKAYRINSRGDRRYRREDIANFLDRMNSFEGNTIHFKE